MIRDILRRIADTCRRSRVWLGVMIAVMALGCVPPARAHVNKIVIDQKVSPAFDGRSFGDAGQYETLCGASLRRT